MMGLIEETTDEQPSSDLGISTLLSDILGPDNGNSRWNFGSPITRFCPSPIEQGW
jgi:hypothetical protein